jgi:hypothetical protein
MLSQLLLKTGLLLELPAHRSGEKLFSPPVWNLDASIIYQLELLRLSCGPK